ncbi:MAG: VOC family protein [Acidimicrobiia bacterium]
MDFTVKFEVAVSDLARSRAWYSAVLDLEPVDPEGAELVYKVGETVFGMYESDNAGTNKATTMRLLVDDFDSARADLLSDGITFEDYDLDEEFKTVEGVLTSPDGERTAWFKDPDGNIIALGSSL